MSDLIATSTLVDIASHSNKVVRLSRFMNETSATYLIDKMSYLDSHSDPIDIVIALDSDLAITAKMLKDVSLMVDSLDENHSAPEFKGDESDFRVLFPNHYKPETKELSLFGIKIKPSDGAVSKVPTDELKQRIYENTFRPLLKEHSYADFKKHKSTMKSLQNTDRPTNSSPFHEALSYAAVSSSIPKWDKLHVAAMETAGAFHDFRRSLSDKERKIVEQKVYSGRAMIYGVVKSSTYISFKNGIEQVSSKHKDKPSVIAKIHQLVQDIPCIKAVEIDQSSSIEKFHDMLIDIGNMGLDIPDSFELKSRLLGNYKACGINARRTTENSPITFSFERGMGSNELRIVAVDVDSPTSVAHEITHFRDVEPSSIRHTFVEHFASKIDVDLLGEIAGDKLGYLMDDREIIARLGEIGYGLHQFDYQPGEDIADFIKRSSDLSGSTRSNENKLSYDVQISKSMDRYAGADNDVSREMYFNLASWSPEETMMLKKFTQGFFFKHDPEITLELQRRINAGELDELSKEFHEKRKTKRKSRPLTDRDLVSKAFGRIRPADLNSVYLEGVRQGTFKDGEFLEQFDDNLTRFGKGGALSVSRSTSLNLVTEQMIAISDMAESIDPNVRPGDALIYEQMLIRYALNSRVIKEDFLPERAQFEFNALELLETSKRTSILYQWGVDDVSNDKSLYIDRSLGKNAYKLLSTHLKQLKEPATNVVEAIEKISTKNAKLQPRELSRLSQASDFAKALGVNRLFVDSFAKDSQYLPETAGDLQVQLCKHEMLEREGLSVIQERASEFKKAVSNSNIEMLLPVRETMADLSAKIDLQVARDLVKNGFAEQFGITSAEIAKHVKGSSLDTAITQDGNAGITELLEFCQSHAENNAKLAKKSPSLFAQINHLEVHNSVEHYSPIVTLAKLALLAGADGDEVSAYLKANLKNNDTFTNGIKASVSLAIHKFDRVDSLKTHSVNERVLNSNIPAIKTLEGLLVDYGLHDIDIPSTAKPLLESLMFNGVVDEYLDFAKTKKSLHKLTIVDVTTNSVNFVLASEKFSDVKPKLTTKLLTNACVGLKELTNNVPDFDWKKDGYYSRAKNEVEENKAEVDTWLKASVNISKEQTNRLLQATSLFALPMSKLATHNAPLSVAFNRISEASKTVGLSFLTEGQFLKDVRPSVDARIELITPKQKVAPSVSVKPVEPKVVDIKPAEEITHIEVLPKVMNNEAGKINNSQYMEPPKRSVKAAVVIEKPTEKVDDPVNLNDPTRQMKIF